ncbi:hypothetical protein FRC05_002373 [Tulasnella sp. 425]|nr:hypothetical protein FRC05_002373 [Tulasnella sp. 425]
MLLTIQPALTVQTTNLYYDYSPLTPIQPASATEAGPSHGRFSDAFNHHFSSTSSSSARHYNLGTSSSSTTTRHAAPVPQQVSYPYGGDYGTASSPGIPPSTSTNHASLSTAAHNLPSRNSLSNFANMGGAGGVGASASSSSSGSGMPYDLYPVDQLSPLGTSAAPAYLEQSNRSGQDYPSSSSGLHGGLRQDSMYELKNPSYTLPGVGDLLRNSGGAGPTRNQRTDRTTAPYSVPSISSRGRGTVSPSRYEDAPVPLASAYDANRDNVQQSPRRSARTTPSRKSGPGSGVPLEKNFACKTCGLKFARNHDLTRHHKVHDPIKHYRCKGCDRSFTRRDALKRHNTQKNCGNEEEPAPAAGSGRGRRRAATIANAPAIPSDDYVEGPPPLARASIGGSVQTGIPVPEAYYASDSAVGRSNSGYIATGMESIARAKLEDSDRYSLRPARQHHPRSAHAYAPYGNASQHQ